MTLTDDHFIVYEHWTGSPLIPPGTPLPLFRNATFNFEPVSLFTTLPDFEVCSRPEQFPSLIGTLEVSGPSHPEAEYYCETGETEESSLVPENIRYDMGQTRVRQMVRNSSYISGFTTQTPRTGCILLKCKWKTVSCGRVGGGYAGRAMWGITFTWSLWSMCGGRRAYVCHL